MQKNFMYGLLATLLPITSVAATIWKLEDTIDPLTDEKSVIAHSSYADGAINRTIAVICRSKEAVVHVDFGEYLNTSMVKVRYRIDSAPMVGSFWIPSASGTTIWDNDASLMRQLMNGSKFTVEAKDFRGVSHLATFDLTGANNAIAPVLNKCNVSTIGLEKKFDGLRPEIANDLERWGPMHISQYKEVLRSHGAYAGPQDTIIEPAFAIAVQIFYDDYMSKCRNGKVVGKECKRFQLFTKSGLSPTLPSVGTVLYEQASSSQKRILGPLKINE